MIQLRIVLLIAAIVTFSRLEAQSTLLKGVVRDADNGTPVPYAALYLQGTTIGAVADNQGKFALSFPDTLKRATLVVARSGYRLRFLPLETLVAEAGGVVIRFHQDDFDAKAFAIGDSLSGGAGRFASFLSDAVKFVTDDWLPMGRRDRNRFDFGRIQTIPTYNPVEGARLRGGIASNARLSRHFFVKGYLAYGFRDRRLKYRGEAIWSFAEKAYHEDEFPKNNLRLAYENDLWSPGEMHPYALNDLLLVTYRRSKDEATYRNFAELSYEREYGNGLAPVARIRRSRLRPQGALSFVVPQGAVVANVPELVTSEASIQLRYSKREAYDQRRRRRIPLETTSPVFFLSHTIGNWKNPSGNAVWHRTDFSAQKRFFLRNAGRLDIVGEAMKVWSRVPFPLLVYPNQRYRHMIENNAFFLNRSLEFVADEQLTLRMTFVGDDLLLSKIPFLNLLKVGELVTLRAAYGGLGERNDPASPENSLSGVLFRLPMESYRFGKLPYVEGTVGITNILGLLRVEYVHRFTYRNHPDALLGAVRVDVTL